MHWITIGVAVCFQLFNTSDAFECLFGGIWEFSTHDENRCDGFNDCFDLYASDECNCNETVSDVCQNKKCIVQKNLCDGVDDCEDGLASDERGCFNLETSEDIPRRTIPCERKDAIRCADHLSCVKASQLCDGSHDCPDSSDEVFVGPGLKCVIKSYRAVTCTLPQINIFDDVAQCGHDVDLCFDSEHMLTTSCFQCLDQKYVISEYQVCDGILDCSDFSDECLCEEVKTPHVCSQFCSPISNPESCSNQNNSVTTVPVTSPEQKQHWIDDASIQCDNGTSISSAFVCNGRDDCIGGVDEKYCYVASNLANLRYFTAITNQSVSDSNTTVCSFQSHNITGAALCDGRPFCDDLADECGSQCEDTPEFCGVNWSCLPGSKVCNGRWDSDYACLNGRVPGEEIGCPNRFYCNSGSIISIESAQVCDEIINCEDGSDEAKERMCNDSRFYCDSRKNPALRLDNPLFVHMSLLFNGRKDCADGSDECPSSFDLNTYSSRQQMIKNPFLKVVVWIIAFFSFFGNVVVLAITIKKLQSKKPMNLISKSHHIMIANLSLADGLMGLYLVMLSIASVVYSEQFCVNKNSWRSSNWCQIMGSLVVLSSQASVFILMLMGAFRFYTIYKPFESQFSSQTFKFTVAGLVLSWMFAFAFALFPWIFNSFITHSYYVSPFFKSDMVEQQKFEDFVKRFNSAVRQRNSCGQSSTTNYMVNVSQNGQVSVEQFTSKPLSIEPKGYLGFYSQNSICLPSYFTRKGKPGWQYGLALITINLISFLLLVLFYALIWRLSDSHRHATEHARSINAVTPGSQMNYQKCQLQKRVARLLLSDFFCWIPICIIGYVHLSGVEVHDMADVISGIVLLPINSALNPILYAGICDKLYYKMKKLYTKASVSHNSVSSSHHETIAQMKANARANNPNSTTNITSISFASSPL